MKKLRLIGSIFLILLVTLNGYGQGIHPSKKEFADFPNWKITAPGDFTFKNFQPYRAVYSRTYTHNKTKEAVNDKVTMSAERVWWFGKKAILFEVHDIGTDKVKDTNGRTQFYYLDEATLEMYLAVGPKAGTPQDYTSVRVLDDKITVSKLNTATGEVEFKETPNSKPTFGFRQIRFMMWAAMDLKVGDKIRLEPLFYAPQSVLLPEPAIVEEQTDFRTPDGKEYKPYVVNNTNEAQSPNSAKFFVINEAPYLLGQGLYNADDDEIYRWWLKLESWELLDGK